MASPGALAAALLGLWGYQERQMFERFKTSGLRSRLVSELGRLTRSPEETSATLQLLGCCALIGLNMEAGSVQWPIEEQIQKVLECEIPLDDSEAIGHVSIQIWIGLREMASLRRDTVKLPRKVGERTLRLWRNSEGVTDRHNALNASMIESLEQCAQNGWVLIAGGTSLAVITASWGYVENAGA